MKLAPRVLLLFVLALVAIGLFSKFGGDSSARAGLEGDESGLIAPNDGETPTSLTTNGADLQVPVESQAREAPAASSPVDGSQGEQDGSRRGVVMDAHQAWPLPQSTITWHFNNETVAEWSTDEGGDFVLPAWPGDPQDVENSSFSVQGPYVLGTATLSYTQAMLEDGLQISVAGQVQIYGESKARPSSDLRYGQVIVTDQSAGEGLGSSWQGAWAEDGTWRLEIPSNGLNDELELLLTHAECWTHRQSLTLQGPDLNTGKHSLGTGMTLRGRVTSPFLSHQRSEWVFVRLAVDWDEVSRLGNRSFLPNGDDLWLIDRSVRIAEDGTFQIHGLREASYQVSLQPRSSLLARQGEAPHRLQIQMRLGHEDVELNEWWALAEIHVTTPKGVQHSDSIELKRDPEDGYTTNCYVTIDRDTNVGYLTLPPNAPVKRPVAWNNDTTLAQLELPAIPKGTVHKERLTFALSKIATHTVRFAMLDPEGNPMELAGSVLGLRFEEEDKNGDWKHTSKINGGGSEENTITLSKVPEGMFRAHFHPKKGTPQALYWVTQVVEFRVSEDGDNKYTVRIAEGGTVTLLGKDDLGDPTPMRKAEILREDGSVIAAKTTWYTDGSSKLENMYSGRMNQEAKLTMEHVLPVGSYIARMHDRHENDFVDAPFQIKARESKTLTLIGAAQ